MRFKTPEMKAFFDTPLVHPQLKMACLEFDKWCQSKMLPEPLVSDLQRTKKENTAIYFKRYLELRQLARIGQLGKLSQEDRELALHCQDQTDANLKESASSRFSWHCVNMAADFSGSVFAPSERERVSTYLKRFRLPDWEKKVHAVAGGVHFHLARRDFSARTRLEKNQVGA